MSNHSACQETVFSQSMLMGKAIYIQLMVFIGYVNNLKFSSLFDVLEWEKLKNTQI